MPHIGSVAHLYYDPKRNFPLSKLSRFLTFTSERTRRRRRIKELKSAEWKKYPLMHGPHLAVCTESSITKNNRDQDPMHANIYRRLNAGVDAYSTALQFPFLISSSHRIRLTAHNRRWLIIMSINILMTVSMNNNKYQQSTKLRLN